MPLFEYSEETKRHIEIFSRHPMSRSDKAWLLFDKVFGLRTTGKWPDYVLNAVMVIGSFGFLYMNKDLSYLDHQDKKAAVILQLDVLCNSYKPACAVLEQQCFEEDLCEELGIK